MGQCRVGSVESQLFLVLNHGEVVVDLTEAKGNLVLGERVAVQKSFGQMLAQLHLAATLPVLESGRRMGLAHNVEGREAGGQLLLSHVGVVEVDWREKLTMADDRSVFLFGRGTGGRNLDIGVFQDADLCVYMTLAGLSGLRRVLGQTGHQVSRPKHVNVADLVFL